MTKTTTKVRCVYDASSKTTGPSLNDCLHPVPSLTESLFGVLLRFRTYRIAFILDILRAFLQILLSEEHQDFARFLWFADLDNINCNNLNVAKVAIYRICRVLFGVTSSPFLLSAVIIEHLQKFPGKNLCSGGAVVMGVEADNEEIEGNAKSFVTLSEVFNVEEYNDYKTKKSFSVRYSIYYKFEEKG